ncbi:uncharacterized protein LOC126994237 [Eriocheir sinensis]|uniref:uncharacterized protein LOC126994237 n=1 Tax=Eriocheir sinensis TaxID=95602 RepID=UPI0021C77972|nr:uncharacterized protein LOC126994237 [Eriocheir sinensis]
MPLAPQLAAPPPLPGASAQTSSGKQSARVPADISRRLQAVPTTVSCKASSQEVTHPSRLVCHRRPSLPITRTTRPSYVWRLCTSSQPRTAAAHFAGSAVFQPPLRVLRCQPIPHLSPPLWPRPRFPDAPTTTARNPGHHKPSPSPLHQLINLGRRIRSPPGSSAYLQPTQGSRTPSPASPRTSRSITGSKS